MTDTSSSDRLVPLSIINNALSSLEEKVVDGNRVKVIPASLCSKTLADILSLASASSSPSFGLPDTYSCSKEGAVQVLPQSAIDELKQLAIKDPFNGELIISKTQPMIIVPSPNAYFTKNPQIQGLLTDLKICHEKHGYIYITCIAIRSPLGQAILSLKSTKPVSGEVRSGLKLYYEACYEEYPFLLNDFRGYLMMCRELCRMSKVYANVISIVQASGFGKSKLAFEAGRLCFGVVLSGQNPTGYPQESDVLKEFLDFIKEVSMRKGPDVETALYIILIQNFLLRVIFYSFKKWNGKSVLFDRRMANDLLFGFREFANATWNASEYNFRNPAVPIYLIPDEKNEITLESISMILQKLEALSDGKILPTVIVYIDEASCLLAKYAYFEIACIEDGFRIVADFYQLFQKATKHTEIFRKHIYLCLISTTSLISNLNPSLTDAPSWRPEEPKFNLLPPFNLVQNYGVFERTAKWPKVNNFGEFVKSSQRMISTFLCGRPLFGIMMSTVVMNELAARYELGSVFRFFPVQNLPKVVAFVLHYDPEAHKNICKAVPKVLLNCTKKYFPSLDHGSVSSSDEDVMKAMNMVFSSSQQKEMSSWIVLSLSLTSFHVPAFIDVEEVIRARMAVLLAVDQKRKRHAIMYGSEGQPNSMASLILNDNLITVLKQSANETFMSLVDPSVNMLIDRGQVGELVARIGLLVTMLRTPPSDPSAWNETSFAGKLYAPRDVFKFVERLAGPVVAADLKSKRPDLEGAVCCFNHFQASDELGSPQRLSELMLRRGSARITPPDWQGADLMIPMVLANGTLSMIVVQVKRKEKVGSVIQVFRGATLRNIFAVRRYDSSQKKWVFETSAQTDQEISTISEKYLIICLNVAEESLELTPESLEVSSTRWSVIQPPQEEQGAIPTGLSCTGLSFAALTSSEREVIAKFCQLGNDMAIVRQSNPQAFSHLGCPRETQADDAPETPHPLYPYSIGEVAEALRHKPAVADLVELAEEEVVARYEEKKARLSITVAEKGPEGVSKLLLKELSKAVEDPKRLEEEGRSVPFELPSVKEFYKSIHWNLYQ